MSQLIIKQDYLIAKAGLASNMDLTLITPAIILAQELKLRPLLGTDLYDLIITQTTPVASLTVPNQYLVDNFILPFLILYIKAKAVTATRIRFTNIGPVIRDASGQGVQSISATEAKELVDELINDAQAYGQLMVRYIRANPTLYPAYFTNTGQGDILPETDSFDVSFYLPDSNEDGLDWKREGLNPFE